jgi:hypothetical protein
MYSGGRSAGAPQRRAARQTTAADQACHSYAASDRPGLVISQQPCERLTRFGLEERRQLSRRRVAGGAALVCERGRRGRQAQRSRARRGEQEGAGHGHVRAPVRGPRDQCGTEGEGGGHTAGGGDATVGMGSAARSYPHPACTMGWCDWLWSARTDEATAGALTHTARSRCFAATAAASPAGCAARR